ncbi:hypothetical protein PoMZ_08407 [Pyricularia oryzae]|uniref:Uncharacterized protein n=2 Tax=Pyricularia oryzae TaxID=318829 RepID=A0A4V1C6Y0_PYROR|nr:hypothetical protein PoMZ_08407 [Pyricularia oryzae]
MRPETTLVVREASIICQQEFHNSYRKSPGHLGNMFLLHQFTDTNNLPGI